MMNKASNSPMGSVPKIPRIAISVTGVAPVTSYRLMSNGDAWVGTLRVEAKTLRGAMLILFDSDDRHDAVDDICHRIIDCGWVSFKGRAIAS